MKTARLAIVLAAAAVSLPGCCFPVCNRRDSSLDFARRAEGRQLSYDVQNTSRTFSSIPRAFAESVDAAGTNIRRTSNLYCGQSPDR